jgi:hypothetical protein
MPRLCSRPLLVGAVVVAALAVCAVAEVNFGFAHSEYGFAFLGKFCFVRSSSPFLFRY